MYAEKIKWVFKILFIIFLSFLLCACQMDSTEHVELSSLMEYIQDFDNKYSNALNAYGAFMRGEIGINNNLTSTIAPTHDSKYTILDMNDDGIPELAVTTVIFQNRYPDTLELESTSFGSAIFSYNNDEVFLWGGGDYRHNNFEILSNKALLYDCDDGHGGREILYHELDENGDSTCEIYLWNSPDGGFYFSGPYPDNEISEKEWHEIDDPILALRTDLISWTDWPESSARDQASETLTWLGESRNDGWRCEGACIDSDGISCDSFLVRVISPNGSTFQEIPLSAKSRTMPTGTAHWEDVNFDGEPDVLVHLGGGRGGTQGYAAVVWNETVGGYQEEPAYAEIGNPTLDTKHKIIWDGADVSFQFDLSAWEYLNGNLIKTHQLSALYNSSTEQGISFIEYELKDGVFSEIQHSVSMSDNIKDVETYISTYAAWEGWKWCDIKHFQQKG